MKVVKKLFGGLIFASLLASIIYVALNPYYLHDWLALRNYTPPARIAQIADATAMTDDARKIFYVYSPMIESSEGFNQHCTIKEASIVLGCYDGKTIYIYDVKDERLRGVHEVTAVHEMLHAAYDRLDTEERERVDSLTARQFQSITDARLITTVAAYRARDPSIVPNELHSILATEVRTLDPALEEYYSQYFTDRTKVVALSEGYEQIFTDIKAKVERLDAELTLLKAQIDALEFDLSGRASSIARERDELNRLLAENNTSEYNARVPGYNESVQSYNRDLDTYRSLITTYNQKVAERNASTVEQNNLIEALDSDAEEL